LRIFVGIFWGVTFLFARVYNVCGWRCHLLVFTMFADGAIYRLMFAEMALRPYLFVFIMFAEMALRLYRGYFGYKNDIVAKRKFVFALLLIYTH